MTDDELAEAKRLAAEWSRFDDEAIPKAAALIQGHVPELLAEVEQLREVADLLVAQNEGRENLRAPEDAAVQALCERHGYGAVMDAAARLWARSDRAGAFTVGPSRALWPSRKEQG